MCYASYREAVEREVALRTRRRERFTAYNITRALREQGFRESHEVLKEVVHCLFRYGKMPKTYRRTFVQLANGSEAFLFHHHRDAPQNGEAETSHAQRGAIWLASDGLFANRFGIAHSRSGVPKG